MIQHSKTAIEYFESPLPEDIAFLSEGISQEAHEQKNLAPVEHFGFFVSNSKRERVGGINGFMYYGCLYIDQLYIHPSYRNQQLGFQLMNKAEKLAISKGCSFSTVSTMDWEAKEFYIKLGYYKEFEREGYDQASTMIFLKKTFHPRATLVRRSLMSNLPKTVRVTSANTEERRQIIFNLSQFYQHDMAAFFEFTSDNLPNSNGLYDPLSCFNLYWKEKNRFPFLVQCDDNPIGFALVNTIGTTPTVNWNMAEFFIVKSCRGKGLGKQAAKQIIDQFSGIWEIAVMPENKQALSFWENVIKTTFPKELSQPTLKTIQKPKPHPMKIFQITRSSHATNH
ncbi:GNAT family N-acetyltransferase [Simkania negevensis]|uniref:GNAT family N-acetyltransferase n=1 Tax=Simkania negevensis TaxID=83561 RepID=A0ABS3AS36_9BACT|nr:GNAT family N-acetyltransferase [Simkania negevensis]